MLDKATRPESTADAVASLLGGMQMDVRSGFPRLALVIPGAAVLLGSSIGLGSAAGAGRAIPMVAGLPNAATLATPAIAHGTVVDRAGKPISGAALSGDGTAGRSDSGA